MRGSARRRVFGGNAGLWLFQKKFLSKDTTGSKECKERRQILSASSTVNVGNNDHLDHSCMNELRASIKCSPESTEKSTCSSTDNDELVLDKSDIVAPCIGVSTISYIGKTHKRGVFRARKRHFENNTSDSDSSVAMFSASSQGDNKRHCHVGTLTNTASSSVPPSTSNIHISSISSPNHTASSIELKDVDAVLVDDSDDAFRCTEIPNTIIADVANLTQQSESTSVFDFDKDPVTKQLGSKTSLDVARQFFAQLDSDQTLLQIEDVRDGPEPPSTKKKSKVVHTTRGKLPSNVAKREYRKYCQACQSSKIKPFSMDRFLQQRSEYFRVGDVYDGMFDE